MKKFNPLKTTYENRKPLPLLRSYGLTLLRSCALTVFLLLAGIPAQAQCPNFMNINTPNPGVMSFYIGNTDNPFASGPLTAPVQNRHTVITSSGYDPNTGNNIPLTPGVIRLGNQQVGAEAEAIEYKFTPTLANNVLLLNFAVVLQDPGHGYIYQPRFRLRIVDEFDVPLEECTDYDVSAGGDIPGFLTFQTGGLPVRFRPWTLMGVDLSRFVGRQVKVQFITYDCTPTAHYGYCYFTIPSCTSNRITKVVCAPGSSFEIQAPAGFEKYEWSNGGGNNATAHFTLPLADPNITCRITSAMGCEFDIYAHLISDDNEITFNTIDATVCEGEGYTEHGFNIPPQTPGTTFSTEIYILNKNSCVEKIVTLNLTTIARFTRYEAAICLGEDYIDAEHGGHGFADVIHPEPGVYNYSIKTGNLLDPPFCETFNVLTLTVSAIPPPNITIIGDPHPCTQELTTYSFLGADELSSFTWGTTCKADSLYEAKGRVLSNIRTPQITVYFTGTEPCNITLQATNGCGTRPASLAITPNRSYVRTIPASVCVGDVYSAHGFNLGVQNTPGFFIIGKDLKTVNGCDSVVNLNLTVNPVPVVHIEPEDQVFCTGEPVKLCAMVEDFNMGGASCSNDNNTTDDMDFVFIHNCELLFNWRSSPSGVTDNTVCITKTATSTTTYTVKVSTPAGCFAEASQTVIVQNGGTVTMHDTICLGDTYTAYGRTYKPTTAGNYPITDIPPITANGCVITPQIDLWVKAPSKFLIPVTEVCSGEEGKFAAYGFDDFVLFGAGQYKDTLYFINKAGCDSLIIFDVTVKPQADIIVHDVACLGEKYTGHGLVDSMQHFAGLQTYIMHHTTTQGCDSTVRLQLMVRSVTAAFSTWCNEDTVVFINLSNLGGVPEFAVSWEWLLDGNPYTTAKDTLAVLPKGLHEVTLRMTTTDGCTDEITQEIRNCECDTAIYSYSNLRYCAGEKPAVLPNVIKDIEGNDVRGTWSPATVSTATPTLPGSPDIYTFTPDPKECAKPITIEVTINQKPVVIPKTICDD